MSKTEITSDSFGLPTKVFDNRFQSCNYTHHEYQRSTNRSQLSCQTDPHAHKPPAASPNSSANLKNISQVVKDLPSHNGFAPCSTVAMHPSHLDCIPIDKSCSSLSSTPGRHSPNKRLQESTTAVGLKRRKWCNSLLALISVTIVPLSLSQVSVPRVQFSDQ